MLAMPKLINKKSVVFLLLSLAVIGYFAWSFWHNRQTIPDYAPPLPTDKTQQKTETPLATLVAVGDIACSSKSPNYNNGDGNLLGCHMRATADLAKKLKPDNILILGDIQYEDGELSEFNKVYAKSWGAPELKAITKPVPGNHEYNSRNAAGYYQYFGKSAGDSAKGYYSFDEGDWHFVALNSNCKFVACEKGSEQQKWLAQDLANNRSKCTLAYWHHPLFSSGIHGSDNKTKDLYQTLLDAKADLLLAGHDHLYERFAPQNANGNNSASGIRSFIVGTGGKSLYPFRKQKPNSEVRISKTFGVLKLSLFKNDYAWEFIAEDNKVLDRGSASCMN